MYSSEALYAASSTARLAYLPPGHRHRHRQGRQTVRWREKVCSREGSTVNAGRASWDSPAAAAPAALLQRHHAPLVVGSGVAGGMPDGVDKVAVKPQRGRRSRRLHAEAAGRGNGVWGERVWRHIAPPALSGHTLGATLV